MKMKAAVVVGPARMEIQEIELPALSPTQMRVRITACGLCHSELGRYLGTGTMWTGQPLSYP
jgi:L-iditol 2-dehydrogenase